MKKKLVLFQFLIILALVSAATIASVARADQIPNYDTAIKEVKKEIGKKDFAAAQRVLKGLLARYPNNPEVLAMLGRLEFWQGEYDAAIKDLKASLAIKQDPETKSDLERVEIARSMQALTLLYNGKKDALKAYFGYYHYSNSTEREYDAGLELTEQYKGFTFVLDGENVHRFGTSNNQVELTIYSRLGDKRWGDVYVGGSPDASFMPRTLFGAAIYQGFGIFDISAGYTRLNFIDGPVNIIIPGMTVYFPAGFFLSEKMYYVPERGTVTLLSSINYRPNPKLRSYFSFGAGNGSEKIGSLQDVERINTRSFVIGGEYRFAPSWSAGTELTYAHRKSLYDMTGGKFFLSYWW